MNICFFKPRIVSIVSIVLLIAILGASTLLVAPAISIAHATTCVDTITDSYKLVPAKINTNRLTAVSVLDAHTYGIQFGSGSNTDQAYVHFDLGKHIDTTQFTHLSFKFKATSRAGVYATKSLLVQMYDNNWTGGKSAEVPVASVFGGSEVEVLVPLAQFTAFGFNKSSVRHVFFRLPKFGKFSLSAVLTNPSLVSIQCIDPLPETDPTLNPIPDPQEPVCAIQSTLPFVLPSSANHNGLTSYTITNGSIGAFNAHLQSGSATDQAYVNFVINEFDTTPYSHLKVDLKVTNTSGAIDTNKPLLFQVYDNYWASGASTEVAFDSSILSGQQTTLMIPLADLNNGVYNPKKARHFFFKLPQTGIASMDVQVASMTWVKESCGAEPTPNPEPTSTPIPEPTPEPLPNPGTNMIIDVSSTKVPFVDRGILGGNTVDDRTADYFSLDLFKELGGTGKPSGTNMNRPMWRVHMIDAGQPKNQMMWNPDAIAGYKCLKNPLIPQQYDESNWASQWPEPLMNGQVVCNGQNYFEVEWFDPSPTYGVKNRHAVSFTKKSGSTVTRYRAFNSENPSGNTGLNQNNYLRFDIKLSSHVPFSVKTEDIIMAANKFRVYLKADKSLEVRGGSNFATVLTKIGPMNMDQWYSVETLIAGGLGSDEIQLGIMADDSGMGGYGIAGSAIANDSFKYVIDEIEVRTKPAGTNPSYVYASNDQSKKFIPEVLISHHFENGNLTWLDYGEMAEALNLELVIQLPHPCETKYGCAVDQWANDNFFKQLLSVEGHKALIQYMTGMADADYTQKIEAIKASGDWTLNKHNWANLRAYHGRVQPFDLRFVEVGNEPYYYSKTVNGKTASFINNESGFADWFIEACEAVKSVKSSLQCGIPANGAGGFNFSKVMQRISEQNKGHLVDAFALHNYVYHPGNRLIDFPFKTMAGTYAYKVHGDGSIYRQMQNFDDLSKLETQYFANQSAGHKRAYWFTEFNSVLANYKYTPTDQALDAIYYATELQYMLEKGFNAGAYFFWNGSTWGEKWRVGVTSEINGVPQVNLNGQVAKTLAQAIPWGGTVVNVNYDSKDANTEISESNGVWKAPKVTAVATKSADGKKLTVVVVNRDSANQSYTLDLKNFTPSGTATVSVLDASNMTETHQNISMVKSTKSVSSNFSHSFPGYSVTVMEFVQ